MRLGVFSLAGVASLALGAPLVSEIMPAEVPGVQPLEYDDCGDNRSPLCKSTKPKGNSWHAAWVKEHAHNPLVPRSIPVERVHEQPGREGPIRLSKRVCAPKPDCQDALACCVEVHPSGATTRTDLVDDDQHIARGCVAFSVWTVQAPAPDQTLQDQPRPLRCPPTLEAVADGSATQYTDYDEVCRTDPGCSESEEDVVDENL